MRIISGKFKGRVIKMPKGIRPTSDRVRESFFEIFKDRMDGADFLDLFAGSGAIGIEAFSRGAKTVSFVDDNTMNTKVLKNNLAQLGISASSSAAVYNKNVSDSIKFFKKKGMVFDVIFLDPPYYNDMAKNTLIAILNYDILARNAYVVAETYKKEILPEEVGCLRKIRTSIYGSTKLEFFKKCEE
jgi:16S rRNA (guanine966-N2)-methyltransferase